MKGKLYGIGVGPGDPELITIKAKRILEEVECIAVPKTARHKESLALSIIKGVIDLESEKNLDKKILELIFPMSFDESELEKNWNEAIGQVRGMLDEGNDVAFITLGDPTVYSTYIYIHKTLKNEGYDTEIIPGITSFCASAARVGISLAENRETIAVVPSAYDCSNLGDILDSFDNVVLMKVSKNFSSLREKLKEAGFDGKSVLVSKCGLPDEVIEMDLESLGQEKLSYFSTIIAKRNGVR